MAPKSNNPRSPLSVLPYTPKSSSASNPLLTPSYNKPELSIKKLFVGLNNLGQKQASATEDTNSALLQLLNYLTTYPYDGILYQDSGMVLADHLYDAYLNVRKSWATLVPTSCSWKISMSLPEISLFSILPK